MIASNSLPRKLALLLTAGLTLGMTACESGNAPEVSEVKQVQPTHSELQPARGLNTQLFAEPVKGNNKRFDRVETAVQNLNDEMNVISPAVIKLMAFEQDMRDLLQHLREQRRAEAEGSIPADEAPVALTPQPQKIEKQPLAEVKAPKVETPKAVATGTGLKIIRLADHKDKTRLVFETSTPMTYTVDLDNTENILIVDFAKGNNSVDTSKVKLHSKLVKSVTESAKGDEGFVLAFPLAKSTRILAQDKIAPGSESPNHRYYIDLAL